MKPPNPLQSRLPVLLALVALSWCALGEPRSGAGAGLQVEGAAGNAGAEPGAPETLERLLSGRSPEDEVVWQFFPDVFAGSPEELGGRTPQPIRVPAQWEFEGQGHFAYGRGLKGKASEREVVADVGTYRLSFDVDPDLVGADRSVELRFDGVMTDTRVFLNGEGLRTAHGHTEHRGGFVPFSFDVTGRLRPVGNELVVAVREESADPSVNLAERAADYWIFGGIYRPVRLLSRPVHHLRGIAIDARADGTLLGWVETRGGAASPAVEARVLDGSSVLASGRFPVGQDGKTRIELRAPTAQPWSPETPRLYDLELLLLDGSGIAHRSLHRIGFRTLEVRRGAPSSPPDDVGLFLNGRRLVLRGINRHSFWPASGRALSPERNRADALLLRDLGFNAVRSSHYPPDPEFLRACDELGLVVVDELPGWKQAYASAVGADVLRSMVERDRNHPSVLFWANGNEGGWNPRIEPLFAELDPQRRPVLRPDAVHGDFDSRHYPSWSELEEMLDPDSPRYRLPHPFRPPPLILPTEMLHGLHDGGGAAGLARYWERLSADPRFAGGFLWALLDEGVERVDLVEEADPDGVRRPFIDTAGNFAPDGIVGPYREPSASSRGVAAIFGGTAAATGPPSAVSSAVPSAATADPIEALRGPLELETRAGSEVTILRHQASPQVSVAIGPDGIESLAVDGHELPLSGGRWTPAPTHEAGLPRLLGRPGRRLVESRAERSGEAPRPEALVLTQRFVHPAHSLRWTLGEQGLEVEVRARAEDRHDWAGLQFDLPADAVAGFRWHGLGPDRIWRNRRTGTLGRWAIGPFPGDGRGSVRPLPDGAAIPVSDLRGVYAVREARLTLVDSPVALALGAGDVGVLRPSFPADAGHATLDLPEGLTFYARAPAMGTRFHRAADLEPRPASEEIRLTVRLGLVRLDGQRDLQHGESAHQPPQRPEGRPP